jgi:hypothetical protein
MSFLNRIRWKRMVPQKKQTLPNTWSISALEATGSRAEEGEERQFNKVGGLRNLPGTNTLATMERNPPLSTSWIYIGPAAGILPPSVPAPGVSISSTTGSKARGVSTRDKELASLYVPDGVRDCPPRRPNG